MFQIRRSGERGHFDHGWLDTYHTFSFGDYYDPAWMGFRTLRVINEDRVAPGQGFGMHGHRDMEIVTVVLSGALEHKDSLGNGEVLRPGEVQRMTAGSGIRHSEFNPSATEPVHLYQIWLLPRAQGLRPGYEQRALDPGASAGKLLLAASPDGADGSLRIEQDARIYLSSLPAGGVLTQELAPGRAGWLQVMRGGVELGTADANDLGRQRLETSDAAAIDNVAAWQVRAVEPAELMYFDLGDGG